MSVNKVILIGYVGGDPTVRFVETRQMAEFRLATSETVRSTVEGMPNSERTDWHNIVMWDRNAEAAERYVRKGQKLYVEGKLRTRYWVDRNAIKRQVTEIYVEKFEILAREAAK